MAWVRIDDAFAEHPKVVAAGPLAMAMQVAALCYCNRKMTDGFVPRAVARTLVDWQIAPQDDRIYTIGVTCGMGGNDVDSEWVIGLLMETGMWEPVPGGYQIHDYHEYQPSKAEAEARKEQASEAGRLGGLAKGKRTAKRGAKRPAKQNSGEPLSGTLSEPSSGIEAEALAESCPVPGPVPLNPPPQGSSENTSVPPTDRQEEEIPKTEKAKAAVLIAERQLKIRQAKTDLGPVSNPKQWLRSAITRAANDHAGKIENLAAQGWDATKIADAIEPVISATPPRYVPPDDEPTPEPAQIANGLASVRGALRSVGEASA